MSPSPITRTQPAQHPLAVLTQSRCALRVNVGGEMPLDPGVVQLQHRPPGRRSLDETTRRETSEKQRSMRAGSGFDEPHAEPPRVVPTLHVAGAGRRFLPGQPGALPWRRARGSIRLPPRDARAPARPAPRRESSSGWADEVRHETATALAHQTHPRATPVTYRACAPRRQWRHARARVGVEITSGQPSVVTWLSENGHRGCRRSGTVGPACAVLTSHAPTEARRLGRRGTSRCRPTAAGW
jgi:hypothetical protein